MTTNICRFGENREDGAGRAVARVGVRRWTARGVLLGLVWLLAGCVTINIYFPAAEAEEAAREIVRDVLQLDGRTAPGDSSGQAPESGAALRIWQRPLAALLDATVSPAAAQSPNIRVETPATRQLRTSMRDRDGALRPFYQAGVIGFGNDAMVAVRDLSAAAVRDRPTVQRLVSEENADRAALYREIARANDRPDWEPQIRQTFARVWADEAPGGYWVQDANGQWRQK